MTLVDLKEGESSIITKVRGRGAFRRRILEMGFVPGQEISVIRKAPMSDPVEYNIMGYNVSLRNSEARLIEIISDDEIIELSGVQFKGVVDDHTRKLSANAKVKIINVALVGNPNCGKTTIFNYASGSQERVGNYGGVTVGAKEAKFKLDGYTFNIVDLPGAYSISSYSPEELYLRDHIFNQMPDVVVNIIDASNLERNLYLTTQLIDMDIKVVAALNMFDDMDKKGNAFEYEKFGKMAGIPIIPTVGNKGKGVKELFRKIIEVYEDKDETVRHIHINYGTATERAINSIQEKIYDNCDRGLMDKISSRFISIKLLEKDEAVIEEIQKHGSYEAIEPAVQNEIKYIEEAHKDDSDNIITDARYGFIAGALKETYKHNSKTRKSRSEILDSILTHKYFGIPIFLAFMWFTFYTTFTLGSYPMEWIETIVEIVSNSLQMWLPNGIFKDLFVNGILGGVGGVVVFLPNIVLLYMFIALMEDTGYMARAVFIMDKAMHVIGLHGKSFIPLLMGFGCNVPAILSSRIIESKRDRLVTMLINPFMSCSARLPVYVLFISAFFVNNQASILFGIYMTGVLLAIISAFIFKKTLFKTSDIPFVMELPPYRVPTVRSILKHMWFRASHYLKKVAGVILLASIIIWGLGYFPRDIEYSQDYDAQIEKIAKKHKIQENEFSKQDSIKLYALNTQLSEQTSEIKTLKESERQEKSYIGQLGKFILPIMEPLGFDWKMSISIITGLSAKEVVVGTIGVLYSGEEGDENESSLIQKIKEQEYHSGEKKGQKVFNPLVALSFMIFILVYFPCIGVVAAIRKESGQWKWAIFSIVYTTSLAWILSFAIFQIGSSLV